MPACGGHLGRALPNVLEFRRRPACGGRCRRPELALNGWKFPSFFALALAALAGWRRTFESFRCSVSSLGLTAAFAFAGLRSSTGNNDGPAAGTPVGSFGQYRRAPPLKLPNARMMDGPSLFPSSSGACRRATHSLPLAPSPLRPFAPSPLDPFVLVSG